MAEKKEEKKSVKKEITLEEKKAFFKEFYSKDLILKNWVALSFFFVAFIVMSPVSRESTFTKLALALFGILVTILSLMLIFESFVKINNLLQAKFAHTTPVKLLVNIILGITTTLMYLQVLTLSSVKYLNSIGHRGTFWCDIRYSFTNLYFNLDIYNLLHLSVIGSLVVAIIVFFYTAIKK